MKYRTKTFYTGTQEALMCERWRQGESLNKSALLFDGHYSAICGILSRTGGIRPRPRHRELYKSRTWDRGKAIADHRRFSLATDIQVYFCDPHRPWQRGSQRPPNRGYLWPRTPPGNRTKTGVWSGSDGD